MLFLFILIMCVVFLVKSYRAGIAIGMDKKVMRRAIMSTQPFSVLPGVSILLGVIALSGSLGFLSWLRLSVVGGFTVRAERGWTARQPEWDFPALK